MFQSIEIKSSETILISSQILKLIKIHNRIYQIYSISGF